MTISELIELLQDYANDLEVEVVYETYPQRLYETYAQRPIESVRQDGNCVLIVAENI
jgi:hypothetical protein